MIHNLLLDPKLLMEARLELRGLLRAQRNQVSFLHKIFEAFTSLITKPIGLAVSGLSVLFIGDVYWLSRIQNTG